MVFVMVLVLIICLLCGFNYLLLLVEMVDIFEVYKFVEVDIDEGLIGGIVVVKICKLFDSEVNYVVFLVKVFYFENVDEIKLYVFGLYLWKNEV